MAPPVRNSFWRRRGGDEGACSRRCGNHARPVKLPPNAWKLRLNDSRQMAKGEASWPRMATVHFEPITVEAFEPQSLSENLQKKRVRSTLWLTLIFWASLWVTLTLAAALAQNPRVAQIALMRLAATFVG